MIAGVDCSKTNPRLRAVAIDPEFRMLYLDSGEIATIQNWILDDEHTVLAVVAPLFCGQWITASVGPLAIRRAC